MVRFKARVERLFAAIGFEAGKLFASLNSAFVRKPFRDDMYGRLG